MACEDNRPTSLSPNLRPINFNMENQEQVQEQVPMMKPNSNMALAIFTTICCCLPLGIVAIIKANSVESLYMAKQYTAAIMAANDAKKWSYIGILISLIVWFIYIVAFGGMAAIAGFSSFH